MSYIEQVKEYVKKALNSPRQSLSHRMDHIERVMSNAEHIAAAFPSVDREILALAVLLHDVSQPYDDKAHHAEASCGLAGEILNVVGYPKERSELVLKIVREHSTETIEYCKPSSIEAKILFDADKIDGLGATGIARVFCLFGQMGKHPLTAIAWYRTKILRSLENICTEVGGQMFREKLRFVERFLEVLESENRDISSAMEIVQEKGEGPSQ